MDLNQVTIEISDFQRSVEFYSKLGLKLIVSQRNEYARFELPSGSSTFSLHVSDRPVAGGTVIYFEVDDVDRKYQELKGLGYQFDSEPVEQDWRWREAYLTDPDGHRLCLYHAGLDRRFPPWRLQSSRAAALKPR